MGPVLAVAAYAVVLAGAVAAAGQLRRGPAHRRVPVATGLALAVVAVPSLLQLTVAPGLLGQLERNREALGQGQLWRLLTALVVQDGGWPGAVFNLVALLVVGVAAERVWGPGRWCLIALVAGVGAQFWGLVVQPDGAGNSVVVFGLAASIAVRALRSAAPRGRVAAASSAAAAAVLLVTGDVHGGAAALGALVALGLRPSGDADPIG